MTRKANGHPTHIKDLVPDPANRRSHNPRNIGMVVDALQQVGAARSIVVDEDNVVLAGNGVVEAAAEAGITRVRVIDADGLEVIAVRRSGLTPGQKRALAMYDNRAGELARWDVEQLKNDRDAGLTLEPFFYEHEVSALFQEQDQAAEHWVGMPEFKQVDQMAWKRLVVNFKNKEAYEAFSRLINQTLTDRTSFIWFPAEHRAAVTEEYRSDAEISDLRAE